jgi:hypothetical protein
MKLDPLGALSQWMDTALDVIVKGSTTNHVPRLACTFALCNAPSKTLRNFG